MSATRDPSEKISFLFTPIRTPGGGGLIRKIKETKVGASASSPLAANPARALRQPVVRPASRPTLTVREHRAREITPAIPSTAQALFQADAAVREQHVGLAGLRKNLSELEDLQKRFRFLLQELEDLL
jgi:L-lysine 2,3-aminomutase